MISKVTPKSAPANENEPKGKEAGKEPGAGAPCPICGKPAAQAFRPFCSKRCADVDLQRWLSGRYAIPVEEDEPPGEDERGE